MNEDYDVIVLGTGLKVFHVVNLSFAFKSRLQSHFLPASPTRSPGCVHLDLFFEFFFACPGVHSVWPDVGQQEEGVAHGS